MAAKYVVYAACRSKPDLLQIHCAHLRQSFPHYYPFLTPHPFTYFAYVHFSDLHLHAADIAFRRGRWKYLHF